MRSSPPTLDQLQRWLGDPEDERLEFKEAKTQFDSDRLTKYCVALANEGGGHIVLGVTDKRPRVVVGTKAFEDLSSLKRDQSQRVRLHIDAIHRELPVPGCLRGRLPKLLELGIIERQAHSRSYLLSQRFYQLAGRSGVYTRRKGLDKETNKELLLKHIKRNKAEGSPLRDLQEVLPAQSRQQVQRLLAQLKREEKAYSKGKTRSALWYPATPEPKEGQP